jgi:ADP-heptose:LPS heptosyltransferase
VWPLDRFLALADALTAAHQAQIVFVLGPAEEGIKKPLLNTVRTKALVVLDSLPLPLLGAVLERSHVFVGNDSGISHMAAAVDVPVVAIFGPTDAAVWAPLGPKVTLIQQSLPCSPCDRKTMARCDHRACLLGISVDEVFWAVSRVIKKHGHKMVCHAEPGQAFQQTREEVHWLNKPIP